jgi:SAM-dependent methyltransferase
VLPREFIQSSIVLAAYVEPVVDGKRVLVIGNATSGLAERLLDRGARLIAVFDPDAARVAEALARAPSQNVSFAPLSDGAWALRDGAFDCALIEDLGALADPAGLLKRVRRALAQRGVALVACPNSEVRLRLLPGPFPVQSQIDYYRLYDLVSEQFQQVKMLGQAPFVGYAVVAFSPEGEPEPAIDTGFLPPGGEEPEHFLALGSNAPTALEDFSVIELPLRNVLGAAGVQGSEELTQARAGEQRAREQAAKLEAENLQLEQTLRERAVTQGSASELSALRAELDKREVWTAQLEARAATADARADAAEEELDAQRAQRQKAEHQLAEALGRAAKLEQQLAEARGRVARLEERLGEHEGRAGEASRVLVARDARTANLERRVAESDAKLHTLESQLAARETDASELRAQLAERERGRAEYERERAEQEHGRAELSRRLTEAEQRLAALAETQDAMAPDDVGELETQLVARASEVRRLERDLREAERIGRELVEQLELRRLAPDAAPVAAAPPVDLPAAEAPVVDAPELVAKLNLLAERNAEQAADLLAARWRVAELEARLEQTAGAAREDLAEAHGELGRQMALLAQIRSR